MRADCGAFVPGNRRCFATAYPRPSALAPREGQMLRLHAHSVATAGCVVPRARHDVQEEASFFGGDAFVTLADQKRPAILADTADEGASEIGTPFTRGVEAARMCHVLAGRLRPKVHLA